MQDQTGLDPKLETVCMDCTQVPTQHITDMERGVYLDSLQQGIQRHGVEQIGYCLMSNHVHLVAVPQKQGRLSPQFEANTWPISLLLERGKPLRRACVWQGGTTPAA